MKNSGILIASYFRKLFSEPEKNRFLRNNKSLTEEEVVKMKKRMTITEVADIVGISPKTILRWEKVGKIDKAKRDWRGWRVYAEEDLRKIEDFRNAIVEIA